MLPAPAHGGPRDAHLLCCISLCFGPYSVEVQLRPSYRRRAGVLPPPAGRSSHHTGHALRFLVRWGFSVVALLPVARWGPPAARPCRYASVTTSERRAWVLRPRACFRLVVPLHQLAWRSPARLRLHHGGSIGDVHRSAASMWQQHAGSGGHANGKLKNFPLFNSSSDSEMFFIV